MFSNHVFHGEQYSAVAHTVKQQRSNAQVMRLQLAFLLLVTATLSAQSVTPTPVQYIPVCTCPTTSACSIVQARCSLVAASAFKIPGPPGPAGQPGAAGKDGQAATITVGAVITLPPGSPVSVTNTGSSSQAILNFAIPQGEVGLNGTNGTNGTDGKDGAPGPPGPQGPAWTPPGLTITTNPDGTPAWSLAGSFSTTGGNGSISLDGFALTCTAAGPKCQ